MSLMTGSNCKRCRFLKLNLERHCEERSNLNPLQAILLTIKDCFVPRNDEINVNFLLKMVVDYRSRLLGAIFKGLEVISL